MRGSMSSYLDVSLKENLSICFGRRSYQSWHRTVGRLRKVESRSGTMVEGGGWSGSQRRSPSCWCRNLHLDVDTFPRASFPACGVPALALVQHHACTDATLAIRPSAACTLRPVRGTRPGSASDGRSVPCASALALARPLHHECIDRRAGGIDPTQTKVAHPSSIARFRRTMFMPSSSGRYDTRINSPILLRTLPPLETVPRHSRSNVRC